MGKKIYISVTSDLVSDQRIHRISGLLNTGNAEISLIGRNLGTKAPELPSGIRIFRFRMLFKKGFLFYAFFNIRLFLFLLFRSKIDVLVSNDLDTLPANYMVTKFRKCTLVFDSHEYFTEVPELIGRDFVKKTWAKIEGFIVPELKFAYTVNDSLAGIFKEKYGTNFEVIRNVPDDKILPGDFHLPEKYTSKKMVLYQGAVNMGRGLEELIELSTEMDDVVFVIAGEGDILQKLKLKVADLNLDDSVYFTGRLRPGELKALTLKANLGVSLEQNMGLNYYYALPNKIFDYIQANIPVLCSEFPEMKKIIDETQTGMTVDPHNKDEIKVRIREMLYSEDLRRIWIKNAKLASKKYCWQNEQKKLIELYTKAGVFFNN